MGATIKEKLRNIAPAIRTKVNDVAQVFNDGFDLVEDTIREGWRESPLNPYNFEKYLNQPPNLLKPLLGEQPALHQHHHPKFPPSHKHKEKAPTSSTSDYSMDNMMNDYGINGYKHFEETILKELERQEELKVEATIHTLFGEGERVEIIRGKPQHIKSGWKPIAAPTKTYEDSNDITSQIISPLHTSIFSLSDGPSESPDKLPSLGFHDFDSLHLSQYAVNEEGIESKVKPVKAKIAAVRRITPVPPTWRSASTSSTTTARPTVSRSRVTSATAHHRKRHNHNSLKTAGDEKNSKSKEIDSSMSESNDIPAVIAKVRPVNVHVQSLTTSKPKNHANSDRNATLDATKANNINYESTSRFRIPTTTSTLSSRAASRATKVSTTTTSRPKTVQREASKFVDRARASGYRGAVKYGQSSTKEGDKNWENVF